MSELLSTVELSLGYGDTEVVKRLSASVDQGGVTALVGPNGCGKSTLLHGIARLLKPQGGAALLDGESIHSIPTKELARRMGILPQGPIAPAGLTVYELVGQGRYPHQSFFRQWSDEDEDATRDALETTGLTEFRDRPVDTLSGGQRQRAWIAMTLAQRTPLLLLDEPTTYLDVGHQLEVMEIVAELNRDRGTTVILVLHDLNQAARYSDRMVVLFDGEVVSDGDPSSVLSTDLLRRVFDVDATILTDPRTGSPVCVPHVSLGGRGAAPRPVPEAATSASSE